MLTYIGIGGNLGDREKHLREGIQGLSKAWGKPIGQSSWYETEAWGMPEGTPPFLNAIVCWDLDEPPHAILERLLAIEQLAGRVRTGAGYASRTLDCDIIAIDGLSLRSSALEIPHPKLASRRFVLEPLMELAPDLWIAGPDQSVRAIFDACTDSTPVRRIADSPP